MTREEAKKIILKHQFAFASMPDDVVIAVNYLVNEPRKGHWITYNKGDTRCSRCGHRSPYFIDYTSEGCKIYGGSTPFCPFCSSDMREEVEE